MAKPIKEKLDDAAIKVLLEAAESAALGPDTTSDLSDQRIRAYDYYMGDMSEDMPAEEGLSSAVSTDVQDVIEGVLPIILDIFVSGDEVVVFKPTGPDDVEAAKQETDYINHVFYQENDGFLVLYSVIKDMLIQKNGFVMWYMEECTEHSRERYKGLTADAYASIVSDKDLQVSDTLEYEGDGINPATGQPGKVKLYDVVVDTVKKTKKPRIVAVPPEEISVSKHGATFQELPYWKRSRRIPVAEAIAKYPDADPAIIRAAVANTTTDNYEEINRETVQDNENLLDDGGTADNDMRLVQVTEHYIKMALEEGDAVIRRYRFTTVGSKREIIEREELPSWPAATGTSIIMPHRLFGRSLADLVIDVAQIKTSLLRAMLNNAYFANNARTEVAETHATENTIDDLLNNRVGGIVRTKMPGGLEPLPVQPIGHWIMPTIEYMDSVRENRTGISRQNQGLDADTLNHTATGVTRLMDAGEMRVKMMARIIAETLFVDMFRGLHQLLQEYGEEQGVIELRGHWVPVDPREWKKREHMKVTLPLGGASKQQLMAFYGQMLGVQKEIIQTQGGPTGPMVTLENVFNTVDNMSKLAGIPSALPFFSRPPPPDPHAPKPPDPKMVEAQANAQATQQQAQADIQIAQQKLQADQQMQQQKMQFEQQREQLRIDAQRARDEQEFRHKQTLDQMQFIHDSMLERTKVQADMAIAQFKAGEEAKLNAQQAKLHTETGADV